MIESILIKVKIVSAIVSFIFLFLATYFIIQFQKLAAIKYQKSKSAIKTAETSRGASGSKWDEVMRHMESPREAEWKFAIVEADKLVDDLLKSAGYPGESMGERLMNIEKGQLLGLQGLWEAHKVRNKLVHDVNYFLRYAEARRAIQLYEAVMRELGAL